MDRYTAPYENFVLVVPPMGGPYSGPRRAERAKETLAHQPRAFTSQRYQGRSPWLVRYCSATLAIAGALALGACAQAPATSAAADIAAVNALRDSFSTAMNAGDSAAIGNLYTADGVSQHNHDKTYTGREAIAASQAALFAQFSVNVEIVPDETKTMGDLGFDRGHYTMTMTPKAGGGAIVDEGRYIVLLRKEADGAWKVSSDIDNSATPLPPPPAAPGAAGTGK